MSIWCKMSCVKMSRCGVDCGVLVMSGVDKGVADGCGVLWSIVGVYVVL